ncbi:hypothetical protein LINPERHAP2_LOCUS35143, partial [Linum perenne]
MERVASYVDNEERVMYEMEREQTITGDMYIPKSASSFPPVRRIRIVPFKRTYLQGVWASFSQEERDEFRKQYGHLAELMSVPFSSSMISEMVKHWDPFYHCFTFNDIDLSPLAEEYEALLQWKDKSPRKIFVCDHGVRVVNVLVKRLSLKREYAETLLVKQGETTCVRIDPLLADMEKQKPDVSRVTMLAMVLYGVVIYPKFEGLIDEEAIWVFSKDHYQVNPVYSILAETFAALDECRTNGKPVLGGCASLLTVWMMGHLKPTPEMGIPDVEYELFSIKKQNYLKKFSLAVKGFEEKTEEQWRYYFSQLNSENVNWKAAWMHRTNILYGCGEKPWVPLLGPRGCITYAPLMMRRQVCCVQFTPSTSGMDSWNFSYVVPDRTEKIRSVVRLWKSTREIDYHQSSTICQEIQAFVTPQYIEWHQAKGNTSTPRMMNSKGKRKLAYGIEEMITPEKYNELMEKIEAKDKEKEEMRARLEAIEKREAEYIAIVHHLENYVEQNQAREIKLREKLREAMEWDNWGIKQMMHASDRMRMITQKASSLAEEIAEEKKGLAPIERNR